MKSEAEIQQVMPNRPLDILLLEDDLDDRELCLRTLVKANLKFHCDTTCTVEGFTEKLGTKKYDVVLADYKLPGWSGMDAFALVRQRYDRVPFILVTGALGDELAVECLQQGVDDYVLKDSLCRLPSVIFNALKKKRAEEEHQIADAALRESEHRFRTLAEATACPTFIYQGTECRYVNRAAEQITGYTREELLATSSWEIIHPDSRDVLIEQGLARLQGVAAPQTFELKILTKEGRARWLDVTMDIIEYGGKPAGLFTTFDITQRKIAEEKILHMVASDSLTRLLNAQGALEAFKTEARRSRRTGRTFALVVLDLDGLKGINDLYGHLIGSRALCRVAQVLRDQCRNIDIPARVGGDEFFLLLPETETDGAQKLTRRICQRLIADGQAPTLSVSAGAAVYPREGQTYEELFEVADRALYKMKALGGGKTLVLA